MSSANLFEVYSLNGNEAISSAEIDFREPVSSSRPPVSQTTSVKLSHPLTPNLQSRPSKSSAIQDSKPSWANPSPSSVLPPPPLRIKSPEFTLDPSPGEKRKSRRPSKDPVAEAVPKKRRGRPRVEANPLRPSADDPPSSTSPITSSATSSKAAKSLSSTPPYVVPEQGDKSDHADAEAQARRQDRLLRNRVAASKCRAKTQLATKQLEADEKAVSTKRAILSMHAAQLRDEVLLLRNEVLRHAGCDSPVIQQYLSSELGRLCGDAPDFGVPVAHVVGN
jgi:hypothetical protein